MKTIEDLPFLKAQAADLERLIRIAPPSAVIAKYQYQENLAGVMEVIASLEASAQTVSDSSTSPPMFKESHLVENSKDVLDSTAETVFENYLNAADVRRFNSNSEITSASGCVLIERGIDEAIRVGGTVVRILEVCSGEVRLAISSSEAPLYPEVVLKCRLAAEEDVPLTDTLSFHA